MLSTILSTQRRKYAYVFALGAWLLVSGSLLIGSYQTQKQDVFNRLGFESQHGFIQFEQHWPDLRLQSLVAQNTFLRELSQHASPALHFSLFNQNGKAIASSLNDLNALSYLSTLSTFKKTNTQAQQCISQLPGLKIKGVQACAYIYQDAFIFMASIHNEGMLLFWLDQKKPLLLSIVFSLGLLLFFMYYSNNYFLRIQSEHETLHDNIKKQETEFKRLTSNLPGILYRLDLQDHSLTYISSGSLKLFGHAPDYFITNNISPFDLIDEDDRDQFTQKSKAAHFSLQPFEMTYRIKTTQGEYKWVLDRGRCFQTQDKDFFVEGVMLDITERELIRQQVEYLGVKDPLTELYNRFKFNDELVQAVSHAKITGERFAMLFIDLDRFKNINDSLGHQLGDRLLQKIAQRLQHILPSHLFLARMGGDAFMVLVSNVENLNDVEVLARAINDHMRQVFHLDTYELRTSCSIGISLCPDHSEHSHILWRYADTAMYQVKHKGGDSYQFFTQELGDMVQHRINIEHSFIPSFKNNQFELYFQPQVDIHSNDILGCEALIRWFHPEMGAISPAEFIPIAEETGFIHILGDWILEHSIQQLKIWLKYNPNFIMSVNVSALQVTEEFPEKLEKLLKKYQIDGRSLELEITESLLMENIDYVLPLLNKVTLLGVGFAIDDFGTGYSSLSYLRYLPINKLKIDRAFVMNIENNNDDVNMVKAIIAMSKSLNLVILAEGIENITQLNLLKELSCERYQGYYFNKPLDHETFSTLYLNPKKSAS